MGSNYFIKGSRSHVDFESCGNIRKPPPPPPSNPKPIALAHGNPWHRSHCNVAPSHVMKAMAKAMSLPHMETHTLPAFAFLLQEPGCLPSNLSSSNRLLIYSTVTTGKEPVPDNITTL